MSKRSKYYPITQKEIDIYKRERMDSEYQRDEITDKTLIALRKQWHKSVKGNKKLEFELGHFSKVVAMNLNHEHKKEQVKDLFNYFFSVLSDAGKD